MKHFTTALSIICTFLASAHWSAVGAAVALGDPIETVVAELGEPSGELDFGTRLVYLYDNGRIEIRDGVVVSIDLLSAAEYAAREQREARQLESFLGREERFKQERRATAERIRSERRGDAAFLLLSASDQLEFWHKLQQQFPEVSFAAEVEALAAEIRQERLRLAQEAEIRKLEQRTAAAEKRAAEAETLARQAQQRAAQLPIVVEPNYFPVYYPQPRPPTIYRIDTCPYTRQGLNSGFRYDGGRLQIRYNPNNPRGHNLFQEVITVRGQ